MCVKESESEGEYVSVIRAAKERNNATHNTDG